MKLKTKLNMTTLCEKYPSLKTDFDMNWRNIIKKCLTEQIYRNSKSSRLTGVKGRCKITFGYLDEDEVSVIQDRISDNFINKLYESDWDAWREKLPNIFSRKDKKEIDLEAAGTLMESIIRCDENGIPKSVASVPKEKTYTVIIKENNIEEGNSFICKSVPIDVAMTTISQLSSALS